MDEQQARALFVLAGFRDSLALHELPNGYWPAAYVEERARSPWWLALTPHGSIKIGWRKSVIAIDWTDTKARTVVTDDDVTKGDTMVHAWGYVKALEYLTNLRRTFPLTLSEGTSNG